MNGTSISSTLEGRCVNTIVLSRPKRFASGTAARAEWPDSSVVPEKIPPPNPYALLAFPYVVSDTDFSKLQRYVAGTRKEGGGWVILVFHHVCDACDYYAVRLDVLQRFVIWLAGQQGMGHLTVKTVGEIVSKASLP